MKILVISDLHIGEKARHKDLNPYVKPLYHNKRILETFYSIVNNYTEQNGKLDFLIIPGDLTEKSYLMELKLAGNFIDEIVNKINLKNRNPYLIPGNHDVDWSVSKGIPVEEKILRKNDKYETLKNDSHLISGLINEELLVNPYLYNWVGKEFSIVGFNSSWHDDAHKENHYGMITDSQLTALEEMIETLNTSDIKIFLNHHHLLNYKNPLPEWVDLSSMQNSESVLRILSKYKFDLIINGHRHIPFFNALTIDNYNPINILCAGSFSCMPDSSIAGIVRNTFHIIELEKLPKGTYGKVLSYEFHESEGWRECQNNDQIKHINPFGFNGNLSELIGKVKKFLLKNITKKNNLISFDQLIRKFKDIEYLSQSGREELIERIEATTKIVAVTKPSGIFFLKFNK